MAACKKKFCDSMLGQLINNSLAPVGGLTGGIIGPCCPLIQPEDLLKPPTSAEGAAAAIMADTLAAKERRAAVRFLGTVDCRYWPEAEMALINALRADRNECVRLEAAISLNRGCCCTKNIIKALALTVASADDDGNPRENSPRVRTLAHRALMRCLNCYAEIVPAPPPPPIKKNGEEGEKPPVPPGETPPPPPPPVLGEKLDLDANGMPKAVGMSSRSAAYYARVSREAEATIVAEAREVLSRVRVQPVSMQAEAAEDRSLFGVIRSVWSSDDKPEPKPTTPPAVKPANYAQAQKTTSPARVHPPIPQPHQSPVLTKPAQPVSHATHLRNLGGHPPTPPAKTAPRSPVTQAYAPATPSTTSVTRVPGHQAATTATAANKAGVPSVYQLIQVLHTDKEVRHRVWAADMLSAYDGWTNSHVVQALVGSAHRDEAPLVRIACLRSLGRMNIRTTNVLTTVEVMHGDPDPNVRAEAQRVHKLLTAHQAANTVGRR
jgi:hypothetical protein